MSPTTTYGLPDADGTSNARHRAYYERRAGSGLGLVIVESAIVHESGRCWPKQLAIHDDRFVPGLAELAAVVKREGPPAVLQLHHGGRVAVEALSGWPVLAPSPLAAQGRPVPTELSVEQIEMLVESFAEGARRAREAGFDGVELHMGTAYLLLSFLSPAQNLRRDGYGGDFEGRMRFPLQIVERIRQRVGADFPVGARIVGSDYHEGGVDVAYCQRVAVRLEEAGLAWLDVSGGVGPLAIRDSPLTMGGGSAVFLDFADAVRSVVSVPVISVGRYDTLAAAEEAVASGRTDLVAFSRALIADPDFVTKSLAGREAEVVPCIACQACHGGISTGLGVSCVLHPETGSELELPIEPAARPRRVLVRGSGVAGLEFARVAAARGHRVTVATGDLPFGGLLALRARVPHAAEVGRGVAWFRQALDGLGVSVVPSSAPHDHDVTVDAEPGVPVPLDVPGLADGDVVAAADVLTGRVDTADLGDRVAVVGPGLFAGETALFLAAAGKQVTLLAAGERAIADAHPLVAGTTALRLAGHGARTVTGVTLRGATGGELEVEADGELRRFGPFDAVVAAVGWDGQQAAPGSLGDTWDAFAQRLLVADATRAAREL